MSRRYSPWLPVAAVVLTCAVPAVAQFSGSVQGNVLDPSGAAVPNATVTLTDLANNVQRTATTDNGGVYKFVSLAPGKYTVAAQSAGFSQSKVEFGLQGNENRDVPLNLAIGDAGTQVSVTSEAPLLDTSDSRNQYTLDSQALSTLPLATRNPFSDIGLTPGVTGGLDSQSNLNYAPENFIDTSANGRGENGNIYVVDGLDVTSNVRPGVVNLTPNADSVQEVNVQTNTYSVQYGRGSGIQTVVTTKSGSDAFHAFASELYTYQGLYAKGEFGSTSPLPPFHTNNLSFGGGGPIWRAKKFYFFATLQPFHQTASSPSTVFYEDPAFVNFAKTVQPNSPGTALLAKYGATAATFTSVSQNAQSYFGTDANGNPLCNTAATDFIPCSTPVIDQGSFNAANSTKGHQYNIRVDKYFDKDRLYANFIRNRLDTSGTGIRSAFNTSQTYYGASLQGNETHTFNDHLINEAAFGFNRIEGLLGVTGDQTVPVVNVNGQETGFGIGFSQGDYLQHSYHWRDVLTEVRGSHSFRFGYDGWHGDAIQIFQSAYAKPVFTFNNLIDLVNDNAYSETNLSYNPVSGAPQPGNYGYAQTTYGLFAEDTWKAKKNLTLTYGLRYDNFGNPYAALAGTIPAPFFRGTGSDFQTQIANGSVKAVDKVLSHSLNWNFAPRVGVAWDPTGSGKYSVHGGFGLYRDQITLGNLDDIIKGNPPNWVVPTFYNDGSTARPIFGFGTGNNYPYGFQYPVLGGQTLDAKGGRVGGQFNIGSTDVNVHTPTNETWSVAVDRDFGRGLVANVAYVGSHTTSTLQAGGTQGGNTFGQDVNLFAGDKIQHTTCTAYQGPNATAPVCTGVQTRLNTSFGAIQYQYNAARANYSGLIAGVRGRVGSHAFFTASYTRSVSKDDSQVYPDVVNLDRYYGNSPYDYPNRLSIGGNYEVPGLHNGVGIEGILTGGWALSGALTLQSGSPITVYTGNSYSVSLINPAGPVTASNLQFNPGSGDYNADGNNFDYPNVDPKAAINTSRSSYRTGVFKNLGSAFTTPALGSEGNERINAQFRNPGFAGTDLTVRKSTHVTERLIFALRLDGFNIFNRVNLNPVDSNLADGGSFGTSTSTHTPRFFQVGGTLSF